MYNMHILACFSSFPKIFLIFPKKPFTIGKIFARMEKVT